MGTITNSGLDNLGKYCWSEKFMALQIITIETSVEYGDNSGVWR